MKKPLYTKAKKTIYREVLHSMKLSFKKKKEEQDFSKLTKIERICCQKIPALQEMLREALQREGKGYLRNFYLYKRNIIRKKYMKVKQKFYFYYP